MWAGVSVRWLVHLMHPGNDDKYSFVCIQRENKAYPQPGSSRLWEPRLSEHRAYNYVLLIQDEYSFAFCVYPHNVFTEHNLIKLTTKWWSSTRILWTNQKFASIRWGYFTLSNENVSIWAYVGAVHLAAASAVVYFILTRTLYMEKIVYVAMRQKFKIFLTWNLKFTQQIFLLTLCKTLVMFKDKANS